MRRNNGCEHGSFVRQKYFYCRGNYYTSSTFGAVDVRFEQCCKLSPPARDYYALTLKTPNKFRSTTDADGVDAKCKLVVCIPHMKSFSRKLAFRTE